jgi:hypothetical protein
VDGVVGPKTWKALFPTTRPPRAPAIAAEPLPKRCLALTGAFETSSGFPDCYCGLAGNFDKQGISFGVLQWNLGQGTLQPLLGEMIDAHRDVAESVFHDLLRPVAKMLRSTRDQQLEWALSIQDPRRFTVFEPWKGCFRALGRTPEFQDIQVRHAEKIRRKAETMCQQFRVKSERALALMFDICVQNGSIAQETAAKIRRDFDGLADSDGMDLEVLRLTVIANRRAEAAKPRFVEDVRARKLTIAEGQGIVHNVPYDLDEQFGIGLELF